MAFLRLSLKKEMCERGLSNEGVMEGDYIEAGGSRAFWNREGEKTGFLPLCMCVPSRVLHKCALS